MDQSYQLNTRTPWRGSVLGGSGASVSSHHSSLTPTFSIPRKPVHRELETTTHGHEPLINANTSYSPIAERSRKWPRLRSCLAWWWPEIVASLVAFACLLTTVAVLRVFDGRSLTNIDLPGSLTLNGIIAAISTVGRAALMIPVGSALSQESWIWFSRNARQQQRCKSRLKDLELSDNASRGAWGSVVFLFLAKSRWIAYLGALITVLSLVFGTFTQQLLAIDQFPVTSLQPNLLPGNLPRLESWQYFSGNPAEFSLTPPLSIRASIYSGILSNTTDPVTVTCATGNCTWPVTPSLAICGECSSSTYEKTCTKSQCTYTMPSGSNITLDTTSVKSQGIGFVVRSNYHGGIYSRTVGNRLYVSNFDVIGASYKAISEEFDNTNTAASECALWMCIQSFSARMADGKLQEDVTMSFVNHSQPAADTGNYGNFTFTNLPAEMNPSPEASYNVSRIGLSTFGGFYSMFNGTANLDLESSAASSDTVDAIWNASPHLNPWISNLATSVTRGLRTYASDERGSDQPPSTAFSRPMYDGTAYQLGIRVQWGWLALPAACVALSTLFLIIIMVQTARSAVVPWKNSLLTFLLFDLDQELKQRAMNSIDHRRGVADDIGNEKAILVEEFKGRWLFKSP